MEDSTPEETRNSVEEKMDSFAEGDLELAGEILSALWETVSGDEEYAKPEMDFDCVGLFQFYFLERAIS